MANTILLVDDEPAITRTLKRILRSEGYNVICENSAQKALVAVSNEDVDVVISDEQMPGMSGNDFLQTIRRENPDIIRIMLTGNAQTDTAVRAINDSDVYRYLNKPCNGLDLAITLRRAIEYKETLNRVCKLVKICSQQFSLLQLLEEKRMGACRVGPGKIKECQLDNPTGNVEALLELVDEELAKSELFLDWAAREGEKGAR